jgi:hypothetical protein
MSPLRPIATHALPLIGWKEELHLAGLSHGPLVAKVDTGARSSALHAEDIQVVGRKVSFRFGGHAHEFRLAETRRIKSSNGQSQIRPVIEAEVELGPHRFTCAITLTDRKDMGVPMLLGREAIKGRFLVHAGRSFLLGRKVR